MKKKNGFTLVELLAVIVILAIIIAIAVPASIAISNRIKKNMFCKKIAMIEQSATLYGQDNFNTVLGKGSSGLNVKVQDLVLNGYLKKDVKEANVGEGAVVNPMDGSSIDNYRIKLIVNNSVSKNRIKATCIENKCNNLCGE